MEGKDLRWLWYYDLFDRGRQFAWQCVLFVFCLIAFPVHGLLRRMAR